MATISGSEFRVLLSTDGSTFKGFATETECSFELNAETRETTSKDDASWRTYVASAKNWTATGSSNFSDDDASKWNADDLYTVVGSSVWIKLVPCAAGSVTPLSGESQLAGTAILTQFSAAFPDKDNATYNFNLQGTGELVKSTIA
jgi:predicted secreted protein